MTRPLASIVINNYNYDRYLGEAIDSALAQTYSNVEVIVVDDGSTDGSAEVIAARSGEVRPVLKENGGQTSALNAGFADSRGDVVCFLDADDTVAPQAIERAVALLAIPTVAHVHWPLYEVDAEGRRLGTVRPDRPLAEGDLRPTVLDSGPDSYVTAPTSGSAWSRDFLAEVFPLEELERGESRGSLSADVRLATVAPLYGTLVALREPQGTYRLHGGNDYASLDTNRKLEHNLVAFDACCALLADECRKLGIAADPDRWRTNSWLHRFRLAREELEAVIPPGTQFVLVDEEQVGPEIAPGRRAVPLVERDGESWGAPDDDEAAIRALESRRLSGAEFAAFAWPAFWWFDHYAGFSNYLHSNVPEVLRNDRLVVFDLRP